MPVVAVASAALYIVWKFILPYFIKNPLDNLPGPPPESRLLGMFSLIRFPLYRVAGPYRLLGSASVFINRQAFKIFAQWAETYGPVFVVDLPFRVCLSLDLYMCSDDLLLLGIF